MNDQQEEPELPCKDKLRFNTEKEANNSALVAKHQHHIKLKSYKCRYCKLWHLASK